MKVVIIVAMGANREIGKNNNLIWRLPRDMKFFKDTTQGHHVIMGRKNYESIPNSFRPLGNRTNVVISRTQDFSQEGCLMVKSLEEGLFIAKNSGEDLAFIIGGGQIYSLALEMDLVDEMYITHVHESFDAEVFFPKFDSSNWNIELHSDYPKDEKHAHSFTIKHYTKK